MPKVLIVLMMFFYASLGYAEDTKSGTSSMIVFDASGSMWGQIEGQAKITIAQEVILMVLADWNTINALGLIAYGHRRKGDCQDIEILHPAATDNIAAIVASVSQFNPKGKTPLSAAVKLAAEELRYKENPATVILVTDGLETCAADPCAVTAQLAATGVNFTTHVIGFDLTQEESTQLRCVAELTGGDFYSANNAKELTAAMSSAVKQVANNEPNVFLSASMRPGGEKIEGSLYYYIYDAQSGEEVTGTNKDQPAITLPPGKYRVKVRHGDAGLIEDSFEVIEEGSLQHTIITGTGTLIVSSALSSGQAPVTSGPIYRVYAHRPDGIGWQSEGAFDNNATSTFRLRAGTYRLDAIWEEVTRSQEISVEPDETTNLVIDMQVGLLSVKSLSTIFSAQNPNGLKEPQYRVYQQNTDGTKGKYFEYCWCDSPNFVLPAGNFIIRSEWYGQSREVPTTIKAGMEQQLQIDF